MSLPTQQIFDIIKKQIQEMQETHDSLHKQSSLGQLAASDKTMYDMLDQWARKIGGVCAGHSSEFQLYYKNRYLKYREIVPGSGIADVAIGTTEGYAKAIQSKSTFQTSHGVIDDLIRSALKQLMGTGNEHPRDNDRCYIHIKIWDTGNTWPFTSIQNNLTLQKLATEVIPRVALVINNETDLGLQQTNLTRNMQPKPNLASTFIAKFPDLPPTALLGRPQGRPRATPELLDGQTKIPTLVVKIIWPYSYICVDGCLQGVTLVGSRSNGRFIFQETTRKTQLLPPISTITYQ